MRTRVEKTIFLTVFVLCCAASMSSALFQVQTQSAGLLSLPPEWSVVSKDETPEQNVISDWTLNVQQTLYARSEHTSADLGADLQIFSIWGTDREGNEKPLPESIMGANGDLVSGLIGEHYGNVSELGEDVIETMLENISVTTYGAILSLADESKAEFRYKYVSLYRGEKRVLVLLKYKPELESYWRGHLETILKEWVGSLTLTPTRAPTMASDLEFLLPLPTDPPPSISTEPSEKAPPIAQPEEPEQLPLDQGEPVSDVLKIPSSSTSRSIPVAWLVSPAAFLWVLWVFLAARKKEEQVSHEPVSAETGPMAAETGVQVPSRALPTLEEWLAEEHLVLKRPNSYISPNAADGEGFDRVHNLLKQALSTLEATGSTEKAAGPVGRVNQEE